MNNKSLSYQHLFIAVSILSAILLISGCLPDEPGKDLEIKIAVDQEFKADEEGLSALKDTYNLQFSEIYEIAIGYTHEALNRGDVELAVGYTTDGKIEELDLISLKDDKGFFQANNPAPVIRREALEKHPMIKDILSEIAKRLDETTMIHLNYLADIKNIEPNEIALNWLKREGFITKTPSANPGEPLIIGSKDLIEQQILGYITLTALKEAGIPVRDKIGVGGSRYNRSAIVEGRIDLYWEYLGNAWSDIFEKEEYITSPSELYQRVKIEDAVNDLIWLDFAKFNNSRTIMMRKEDADILEITTLSELSEWIDKQF